MSPAGKVKSPTLTVFGIFLGGAMGRTEARRETCSCIGAITDAVNINLKQGGLGVGQLRSVLQVHGTPVS